MRKSVLMPLALASASMISAPAFADEPYAVTPSGRTEAIFDLPVVQTSDKIMNGCADIGWTVVNTTSTMVVCEAQLSTLQSVLAALTMGNQYSTPPKQFIRFNIGGLGQSSRVQATGWMETQMAFGQTRTEEMSAANYHNNVMALLTSLGGQYPRGTTFPYHAFLGAQFENTDGKSGVRVTSVETGAPGDRGGLQAGDVITRLSKEKIKSGDDLLDGMRKAAKDPTYAVEVRRDGKPLTLTLERAFRAEIEGPDLATLPAEPEPAQVQAVMALSPADELAKFAKLRDDGVITPQEFEAQKTKILGSN